MDASPVKTERLTEFERAVCYDTLPRFTRPLAPGVVFAYAGLLIASFLVLAYGLRKDLDAWKLWGAVSLSVVVFAGIVGFLYRALYYAIRQRRALLSANEMPNVESGFDALPDPFASHTLLRYHRVDKSETKTLTGNKGEVVYTATRIPDHGWEVHDPAGDVLLTIRASRPPRSFSFDWGVPSQFHVVSGDTLLAEIERPRTLGRGRVEIRSQRQPQRKIVFRDGGLFDGDDLIGRIYIIRNYLYLDVRQSCLDDAVLGFFICMLD